MLVMLPFKYMLCILLSAALTAARKHKVEYDYIVAGGGAAGCVVASRLSEDPDVNVLLLEAGYDPVDDPFVAILRLWPTLSQTRERYSWGYESEPQRSTNKRLPFMAAKLLGGSSSHNAMVFTRGSPHNYDRWSEMGNPGWDYQSVLPFFKKLENMVDPRLADNGFHGTKGPVKVRLPRTEPIFKEIFNAATELGIKEITDYNGPELEGIGHVQIASDNRGQRMSSLEAYLRPVMARRNLDVITEALVTKIIIKKKKGKLQAKGVIYRKNGKPTYIRAKREVIVSGGSLNSPKLLMLSGVGPKKHLKDIGIKVLADLPVGKNLQNHWGVLLPLKVSDTSPIEKTKMATFESLFEYIFTGKGPWATAGEDGITFFRADSQPADDLFPHMILVFCAPPVDFPGQFKQLRDSIYDGFVVPELVQQFKEENAGYKEIFAFPLHYHPRHRGQVQLNSTDPQDHPKITLEHGNRKDGLDLVQAIRLVQKLVNTQALKNAGMSAGFNKPDPHCKDHVFDSDDYWLCYIKYNLAQTGHMSTTCKMSPDSTGVVDNKLRVKGIAGLRVVDSSVMPESLSSHAYAPTLMIGEKGAHMIKQTYLTGK